MNVTPEMRISEVAKLPGVADLPTLVRGRFAQALMAEAAGDHAKAQAKLDEAVEAEEGKATAK